MQSTSKVAICNFSAEVHCIMLCFHQVVTRILTSAKAICLLFYGAFQTKQHDKKGKLKKENKAKYMQIYDCRQCNRKTQVKQKTFLAALIELLLRKLRIKQRLCNNTRNRTHSRTTAYTRLCTYARKTISLRLVRR